MPLDERGSLREDLKKGSFYQGPKNGSTKIKIIQLYFHLVHEKTGSTIDVSHRTKKETKPVTVCMICCPRHLTWKENFLKSIAKKKPFLISCLSFVPCGWKGISRAPLNTIMSSVYLRWISLWCFSARKCGLLKALQSANATFHYVIYHCCWKSRFSNLATCRTKL